MTKLLILKFIYPKEKKFPQFPFSRGLLCLDLSHELKVSDSYLVVNTSASWLAAKGFHGP